MFRKPITIHARSKVSGADRKKLRRALEQAFGGGGGGEGEGDAAAATAASEQIDAFLPAKAGELELLRPPAPSRVHIYALRDDAGDGSSAPLVPILLDLSGKGDLVPTVQGLWRAPGLLPRVPLKHPLVSRFVVKGADVMLPGIDASDLPLFEKGDLVAVISPGNDAPVAVGRALLASRDAGRGGGGKAVEVVSFYGDTLWRDHGGAAVPNAGFRADVVLPPEGLPEGEGEGGGGGGGGGAGADEAVAAAAGALAAANLADGPDAGATTAAATPPAAAAAAATAAAAETQAAAEATAAAAEAEAAAVAAAAAPPVDMDALIEASLLQALHASLPDAALPIAGSTLWREHVLPSRPAGAPPLDVKRGKHKRIPKTLQAYAKLGLLFVREDRASGDVHVTRVNRAHALLAGFVPHATEAAAAAAAGATGGAGTGGGGAAGGGAGGAAPSGGGGGGGGGGAFGGGGAPAGLLLGGGGPLAVEEVYVPGRELKPVFEAVGLDPAAGYGASAAAAAVAAYAARLPDADGGRAVLLDAALCDGLLKGVLKKGELYPSTLPKAALAEAALARCAMQTRVSRGGGGGGGDPLVRKGSAPVLQISSEKRQGTRRVTKIAGLEQFLICEERLAAEAAKRFSAAATLEDALGKHNKAKVVCVQGDVVDAAVAWLCAEPFGVPRRFVEVKKVK